ncbi:MAG TPA: phenylalanine--tRNA ligase subunit alpha [Candidatus Eisenbacteria bacterium]|nr:phenylalanine--tRNA ligase subunit alpha [Candidatus Eisenbacteria bacterium]
MSAAVLGRDSLPEAWETGPYWQLTPECLMVRDELAAADPDAAGFFARAAQGLLHAPDLRELEARELTLLGRERGLVTRALGGLGALPVDERKRRGRSLNVLKRALGELAAQRRATLEAEGEVRDALDVTLPGLEPWVGHAHVLAQVRDELLDLFHGLGYSQYASPEVEWDAWNFGKLNFPPDHPARDAHDTYFVTPQGGVAATEPLVMRTHTSPGWVRAMEELEPPLRLVFPGRVYRAEQVDASHMDQFHQMDGLFVAERVSMADLKATLNLFARRLVSRDVRTRLIPIYFPFVEPGCQLDVACAACGGRGALADGARCPVCKGSGWSELLGAGMVHPNVFRAVGYDPERVTGFAFGIGLERTAMARLGISEIRLFLENDVRFLEQF